MSTIYCDEAGNSGESLLLDKEQPYFVLASNDYSHAEALELLELVRSSQGGEPKFKTLRKSADGINRLIRLLTDPRINQTRIFVDMYHKRYMVFTKMVDLALETQMHEDGIDLYEKGGNIAMANMLHACMPVFCGEQATEIFLSAFVELVRHKTAEHIQKFLGAGDAIYKACSNADFAGILVPIIHEKLFSKWFDHVGPLTLDPAIPALFQHINAWGNRKTDRFRVIHDQSKPVLASKEIFESMMAIEKETSTMIGYDRRKFQFPLRALSLEQGDSSQHPQIQLADICAGAINYFLKSQTGQTSDELAAVIKKFGFEAWNVNGIWPSTAVTPADLGTDSGDGVNPIDPIVNRHRANESD